jgi:inner membrane protein
VTAYRTVERSIKHGVLFITLGFAAFFLFEVLGGQRLHALNYLLVGAALCLFYLGLLALSEFAGFGVAYLAAAGASTALIGLYARAVLEGARRAWGVTAVLAGVYAYLFLVLRLEDFALLAGTAGLFAILAAIMYATRNLRMDAPRAEVSA